MAVQINIFGNIGGKDGQTKEQLSKDLTNAGGQEVVINVSSSGGDVFEGLAMQALIKNYSGKTVSKGIGLVASAATIILLAAKKVQMSKNSFFMLHNSWGYVTGNAAEMEQTINVLKKVDEDMVNIYIDKMKKNGKLINESEDETYIEIKKMMQAETWLTSEEAMNFGLIDEIIEEQSEYNQIYQETFAQIRAQANYKNIPNQILNDMSAEKKSFLKLLASWLGLNAEISDEVIADATNEATKEEVKTEPIVEAVIEEAKEEKTETVEAPAPDVKAELLEVENQIKAKKLQLEAIEAELQAKISYKTETKADAKIESGFTADQIVQASKFINSLINKN